MEEEGISIEPLVKLILLLVFAASIFAVVIYFIVWRTLYG